MDKKQAIELCDCKLCPSYVECGEEIAFCLSESGLSNCIKNEDGCLCPGCPVQEQTGFRHVYYCTRGSERHILEKI